MVPQQQLHITSVEQQSELFDLPWQLPLIEWPAELLASLPRGISRHVVRFVKLGGHILAVKEITDEVATREYSALRQLTRDEAPCVEPVAVVSGRTDSEGNSLPSALITRHLAFSLPYRILFGQASMRPETADRLIGALAVLMVRLHLLGFYWGDVSLSNTLFRRDAEEFAAYLVDAETGEFYPELSDKRRLYDIEVASVNIVGELMDLQAGGVLSEDFDSIHVGTRFEQRYNSLWYELTSEETFSVNDRWRIDNRIRRLNDLGFDVGELQMSTTPDGTSISIKPRIVDAGHYSRKIMQLTGMDVQEKQARRMLNSIEQYRIMQHLTNVPMSLVAHGWMTDIFEPIVRAIPRELRSKLEPAQVFHELLDHRWFMAERAGHDISLDEAVRSYVEEVLEHHPDESHLIMPGLSETGEFAAIKEQQDFAQNYREDFDDEWSGYLA
ncbi:MAG: DUF4032 domain-containing protein [Arcanobacterium sp.]|nr:DUF4032 domain-containing protein [Arcanobacterium sp.]MDY5589442.1 DUF4032 domain-containing protein [Arcanobacterium sp.]